MPNTPPNDLEALRAKIIADATATGLAAEARALAAANKQESWAKTNVKPLVIGLIAGGAVGFITAHILCAHIL